MRGQFLAALAVVWLVACRSPTQIDVEVSTNVPCVQVMGTSLTSGTLGAIENVPATTETSTCSATHIGSVVLVPSGQDDALVGFKVVTALDGERIDDCVPDDAGSYGQHCIVARRALRYLPHTPLVVDVLMSSACAGIGCDPFSTCVEGTCVPATITDPSACEGSGCSEQVLSPDGGVLEPPDATLPSEGGPDATVTDAPAEAPEDAALDSPPTFDASVPGVPGCDLGGAQPGAAWPMADYCPTHRNRSPFVGPTQTPHLLWYQNLPGTTLGAPSIGADGTVYIGASGVVDAFEPLDGGLRWQYVNDAGLYQGTPLLAADFTVRVLDDSVNGDYVSIPLDGGAPLRAASPGSFNFRGDPTIAHDGTMYASSTNANLVAIDSLGHLVWAAPQITSDFIIPTVASNGTILTTAGSSVQEVVATYADGGPSWQSPTDASAAMGSVVIAVDGSLRVASPSDGILYALTADGSPMWTASIPQYPGEFALIAVADDGTTYAGGSQGLVAWSATGASVGTFGTVACVQPVIDAVGNVYDFCDGTLYGLDSQLNINWSLPLAFGQGQTVNDSPVLGPGGTIYVSTDTENAIQPDGGPADAVMAFGP